MTNLLLAMMKIELLSWSLDRRWHAKKQMAGIHYQNECILAYSIVSKVF